MASRAHLLSGLRTGGPAYDTDSSRSSPRLSESNKGLKADAAPFTPSTGRAAQADIETQGDLNSIYGATQGQAIQQENMANMIRQRQAQMMQQQLLAQQQLQQQQQMEMYRLHAASQQQHHLQEVAAKQRLLLAQMQAEYSMQQQEQAMSAQDQRMAAQATIQASLRQRQAEQVYAQLFQQQDVTEAQAQQQQLLQQLQLLQLQAATVQSMQQEQQAGTEEYYPRRNGITRSDSPGNVPQQNRRDRQASYAAAENATSWRSASLALPKASSGRKTPSIVVDDSASEKSNASHRSDSETPETSEEDIIVSGEIRKSPTLNSERRLPSNLPRPLALNSAPRNRNFSIENKMMNASINGSLHGNNATRQPRGPPTEFIAINFTTRMSARTRREAMSKLCASPRAASFATAPPRPTAVA